MLKPGISYLARNWHIQFTIKCCWLSLNIPLRFAGGVDFQLFWCDTVRSGCWTWRGSDLCFVCRRYDSLQVKSTLLHWSFAFCLTHKTQKLEDWLTHYTESKTQPYFRVNYVMFVLLSDQNSPYLDSWRKPNCTAILNNVLWYVLFVFLFLYVTIDTALKDLFIKSARLCFI